MKLHAIASAIYGDPNLRITTTVVAGEQKDAISIERRSDAVFRQSSIADVTNVFTQFLEEIVRIASDQRQLVRSVALPVIFGWPPDTDHYELVTTLMGIFPQFFAGKKFHNPCLSYEAEDNSLTKVAKSKAQMARVATLVESFAEQDPRLKSVVVEFMSRGFINTTRDLSRSEIDAILAEPSNDQERQFIAIKERAATRPVAKQMMIKQVRVWAREFASSIKTHTGASGGSRFIMTGLPHLPEMISSIHRNCFYNDEELRQIFAAEIIRLLGIDHHIALKCPRDLSAPPFSDVAATFVADKLNLISDGVIKPQAVRVKLG